MPVARAHLPRFTDRLALGGQGLAVSPFCVGMVALPETIGAAFDAGINFFFVSADMHWPLYEATRVSRGSSTGPLSRGGPGHSADAGRGSARCVMVARGSAAG